MNIGAAGPIHRAILIGAFGAALDCGNWRDFRSGQSQPCVCSGICINRAIGRIGLLAGIGARINGLTKVIRIIWSIRIIAVACRLLLCRCCSIVRICRRCRSNDQRQAHCCCACRCDCPASGEWLMIDHQVSLFPLHVPPMTVQSLLVIYRSSPLLVLYVHWAE